MWSIKWWIYSKYKTYYWYNLKQLKQALNTDDSNGKIPIDYAKDKEKTISWDLDFLSFVDVNMYIFVCVNFIKFI